MASLYSVAGLPSGSKCSYGSWPGDSSCYFNQTVWSCPYKTCPCTYVPHYSNETSCAAFDGTAYTDSGAAYVLIAAILVFFMKAGFMLLESAFAESDREKREIIIAKNVDVFASAMGFFLFGCDYVFGVALIYKDAPIPNEFFSIQQPLIWFFKFTFASNTATLIGGCLINFKYHMRLISVFISAFIISGVLHPVVTRVIWGYDCKTSSLSPYRFCVSPWTQGYLGCNYTCDKIKEHFLERVYAVDFAGGGTVHLLGGVIGLVLCLFAKHAKYRDSKSNDLVELDAIEKKKSFFQTMYPVGGGKEENVEKAALGVLILWFGWFAFNCGSAENISGGTIYGSEGYAHSIVGRIAVNMILCCASGGTLAVIIACWAQIRYKASTVNANEIANGVLSCLVAITSGCPFLPYYMACLCGIIAVILYHFGVWLEYKWHIPDTARVVPVHGICGLFSMLFASFGALYPNAQCLLHAAYEATVFCQLRLPELTFWELLCGQIMACGVIIASGLGIFIFYFVLYSIQLRRLEKPITCCLFLNYKNDDRKEKLDFSGNLLFSSSKDSLKRQNTYNASDSVSANEESRRQKSKIDATRETTTNSDDIESEIVESIPTQPTIEQRQDTRVGVRTVEVEVEVH